MRNNEAAGIAVENVDLDNGILTILDSKGSKDRLVYLPDDLRESSRRYFDYLKDELGYVPKWFFPGKIRRRLFRIQLLITFFRVFGAVLNTVAAVTSQQFMIFDSPLL